MPLLLNLLLLESFFALFTELFCLGCSYFLCGFHLALLHRACPFLGDTTSLCLCFRLEHSFSLLSSQFQRHFHFDSFCQLLPLIFLLQKLKHKRLCLLLSCPLLPPKSLILLISRLLNRCYLRLLLPFPLSISPLDFLSEFFGVKGHSSGLCLLPNLFFLN